MDLGRIELPSKRGNHMLSTCLSLPSFFEYKQDQSHQLVPYPLKFRKNRKERFHLFPILLCRFAKRFGTRAFERHPVSATVAEIKVIYYSSITLREHKYCCHNSLITGIKVPITDALHAYIPFQLAVNSSQAHE